MTFDDLAPGLGRSFHVVDGLKVVTSLFFLKNIYRTSVKLQFVDDF